MPRIFVQMVSFRDPECHHTITDLFDKAADPARITVGVCWQYDPEQDADLLAVPYPRREQVRVVQYHVRDAQGAGWARAEAQKLWSGEEYVLQIQAHHRFEPGWDDTLIDMLEGLPTTKAALTAWLPNYTPPDDRQTMGEALPVATINRLGEANDPQIIHLVNVPQPQADFMAPFLTALWVGNFLFARAELLREVPPDPHIYFWGEELNYSARLWTHGYDLYHLNRVVLYHYWNRREVRDEDTYRAKDEARNQQSLMRNLHVLRLHPAQDESVLAQVERYGLGTQRRISEYFSFIGVDMTRGQVAMHARMGRYGEAAGAWKQDSYARRTIFVAIASYRDPETMHTVQDLYARADHPERIFVGICHQLDFQEDEACDFITDRPEQVAIERLDYRQSQGANWARNRAMQHYRNQDYILVIDSHMRFQQGWDEVLIDMIERCPSEDALLTAYLPGYKPPDERDYVPYNPTRITVGTLGGENDPQLIHLTGHFISKSSPMTGLYRSPFVVANFMFAPAAVWQRVPIDPHIYFYGDEISLAVRLWTHGVDVYQPDGMCAYHYWGRAKEQSPQPYRKRSDVRAQRNLVRVQHLLGLARSNDEKALVEIERYGVGDKRTLADFWEFAGVDLVRRKISDKAKQGIWNETAMATKKKAPPKRPRIFVQIASYRDPECQHTIKDLFEKATHPERIFVGICWQYVKEEDAVCFQVPYPLPRQVRVHEVDARQGKGVCWARSLTQALWKDEEFTLQIDSHMRFEPGWDETLLAMYEQCGGGKSVLTCYPPGYTPPDKCEREFFFGMAAKEFDKNRIFKMSGVPAFRTSEPLPPKPMRGAFASACMLFGPASIIRDVPYDPSLYFFGEEITLAVRLWTHGYDLYHPNAIVMYHDWDRSKRPTHFTDHPKDWGALNDRSLIRVRHLLGTEQAQDTQMLADLDQYGLGTVRALAEYERYSGVDFKNTTFNEHARKGIFHDGLPRIFVRIASYRDPECQWTVKDLFEKAAHPDRIFVGICWQFDEEQDAHCFAVSTRPEQVRVYPVPWRETEGVCWARAQTEMLHEGEEYTLQIDSHMRFAPDWDEMLINELAACPSAKPILSSSPAIYTPPHNLERKQFPNVQCMARGFNEHGNIRGIGQLLEVEPEIPLQGPFLAAGLMFSRSEVMAEVPYDPYLYFDQEEITYAARLFTHGWDIFNFRRHYVYHLYNIGQVSNRPLHWSDLRTADQDARYRFLMSRGLKRMNHVTRYSASDEPEVIADIDKYDLGTARTLEEYEAFSGVDFRTKTVHPKAIQAGFIKDLTKYRKRPIPLPSNEMPHASAGALPYDEGDLMPHFVLEETTGRKRGLESYAGKPSLMFLLRYDDPKGNQAFFVALREALRKAGDPDINLIFMVDSDVDRLKAYQEQHAIAYPLLADQEIRVGMSLGISSAPCAFLLSELLQIKKKRAQPTAAPLAVEMVRLTLDYLASKPPVPSVLPVVMQAAPVLVLPDILPPSWCDELLAAFKAGEKIHGEVGDRGYVPGAKERQDFIVPEALRKNIDLKLSHSLFPEIEKVFGFRVVARENYKIGLYAGEEGGFFSKHRDNYDETMGYRRIAFTLHLSDDYEGGGVRFPEYDAARVYRPGRGGVVAFPCTLLHEALKVTQGERYVLLGFVHGEEEEMFRQGYAHAHAQPLLTQEFFVAAEPPVGAPRSRDFFRGWQGWHRSQIQQAMQQAPGASAAPALPALPALEFVKTPIIGIGQAKHQPTKVFECRGGVVFDNFLPPDVFEQVHAFCVMTDYEYINTKGKISRAWHAHDGFPMRSTLNAFYYADKTSQPMPKPDYGFPTNTVLDRFIEFMVEFQPQVEFYTGKPIDGWAHFSVTSWLYPPGTGLSMHDDGSGVYTGAYAFFLNKQWRPHWGGINILMDDAANDTIHAHRRTVNQFEYHKQKWLHQNNCDDLLMQSGIARAIFPKRNRIVFIANDAYHMVTRVNETAGDNLRMSLAGFFDRKKQKT